MEVQSISQELGPMCLRVVERKLNMYITKRSTSRTSPQNITQKNKNVEKNKVQIHLPSNDLMKTIEGSKDFDNEKTTDPYSITGQFQLYTNRQCSRKKKKTRSESMDKNSKKTTHGFATPCCEFSPTNTVSTNKSEVKKNIKKYAYKKCKHSVSLPKIISNPGIVRLSDLQSICSSHYKPKHSVPTIKKDDRTSLNLAAILNRCKDEGFVAKSQNNVPPVIRIVGEKRSSVVDLRPEESLQNLPKIMEQQSANSPLSSKTGASTAKNKLLVNLKLLKGGRSVIVNGLRSSSVLKTVKSNSTTTSPSVRLKQKILRSETERRTRNVQDKITNSYYSENFTTSALAAKQHDTTHFPLSFLLEQVEDSKIENAAAINSNDKKPIKNDVETSANITLRNFANQKQQLDDAIAGSLKERREKIVSIMRAKRYLSRLQNCENNLIKLANIKVSPYKL